MNETIINRVDNRILTDKGTVLDFPLDFESDKIIFEFHETRPDNLVSGNILMHGTVYKKNNDGTYISFGGLLGFFKRDIASKNIWLKISY